MTYVGEGLEVELEVDEAVAVLQLQPNQHTGQQCDELIIFVGGRVGSTP